MMQRKKTILLLCMLLLGLGVCYQFRYQFQNVYKAFIEEEKQNENIDFAHWQGINPDVYAWIRVEDTPIDYPVLQSAADDYYLKHDIYRDANIYGAIYTESGNSQTFTDANTIVYGHHMRDRSMFGTLSEFLNQDYFDTHKTIKIFTPKETRVYLVVAAYEYPADHLLSSVDLSTPEAADTYIGQIPAFVHNTKGVLREEAEIKTPLLTLSTCTADDMGMRCLVQAVLVESQPAG